MPALETALTSWRKLSRSHVRALLAAGVGAGAGAAYAHFVGCSTGSCPLTASIWRAAAFGSFVGAIAGWPAAVPRR